MFSQYISNELSKKAAVYCQHLLCFWMSWPNAWHSDENFNLTRYNKEWFYFKKRVFTIDLMFVKTVVQRKQIHLRIIFSCENRKTSPRKPIRITLTHYLSSLFSLFWNKRIYFTYSVWNFPPSSDFHLCLFNNFPTFDLFLNHFSKAKRIRCLEVRKSLIFLKFNTLMLLPMYIYKYVSTLKNICLCACAYILICNSIRSPNFPGIEKWPVWVFRIKRKHAIFLSTGKNISISKALKCLTKLDMRIIYLVIY